MMMLAQAQSALLASVACSLKSETLPLALARGRVISDDVVSGIAIPPFDNSAMDGFAVNSMDLAAHWDATTSSTTSSTTNPIRLPIAQRIPAGVQPQPLHVGTAARIFTGGVMPEGANAVVIQENCDYDSASVTVLKPVAAGDNLRPAGQDICKGETVVHKGQRLTAIDLGLLASIGHARVTVYQPLKVGIFSTGDELVEPGQPLAPGQIYNSNRTVLMALCQQLGFVPVDCGIVEDTYHATKAALVSAADQTDFILSSGGVSVGEEDHVRPAVEALGSLDLWKVQMKPGKPVAFGEVAGTPFLGLPGNPVSSFVVFQLLGVPLARALQGQHYSLPKAYSVVSGFEKKMTHREEYIRVKLERDTQGQLIVQQHVNSSSGVMSSLSWANGLVRQSIDQAITVGQSVEFLPLNEGML